ncbi:CapA family protein [Paenisporosarcina sp. FSL H8-0542]|uniref:CapA family protein n=1 Tax=Paenisporosarcina sp. FSL H8-0542 TaxID=2921401 RepID=UPI00315A23C4
MKKYYLLIALCMLIVGCSHFSAPELPIDSIPVANAMETEMAKRPVKPITVKAFKIEKPVVTTAKLVAIGDILLHQPVYKDAKTTDGTYDFTAMFEKVKPFIESADIAVANQETMIGGPELGLSSYPKFNSPYEIGDALKYSGIDLVTIANNHTLDRGEKAILNAIDYWDQIEMPYTGAFKSPDDRNMVRTVTKNDITFSFLSYSYGTNGMPVPEGKPYLINLIDLPLIEQDVKKAKTISDVVVVSMHWGNEYEKTPNDTQINLANELSSMGVDIIIGHHPHVLQPVDWIERPDGTRTFVMYSLGNFLSSQEGLEKLTGGIGGVEITKVVDSEKTVIKLDHPSFVPTYGYYKNKRDFEVIPMHLLTESYLPGYQTHYENTQRHLNVLTNELTFIEK